MLEKEVIVGDKEPLLCMSQVGDSVWIGGDKYIFCVELKVATLLLHLPHTVLLFYLSLFFFPQTSTMFKWMAHQRPITSLLYESKCVWSCANDGKVKVTTSKEVKRRCGAYLRYRLTVSYILLLCFSLSPSLPLS